MSVKIRVKKGCLYLDIIQNRIHHWEALHIRLSDDPILKKQQMEIANKCRAMREMQLVSGEWGFVDKIAGNKSLIDYAREVAKNSTRKNAIPKMLVYLEKFRDGGNIKISQVDSRYVESFQDFLLKDARTSKGLQLSQTTASKYSSELRHILNKAVSENILSKNPAETVKGISPLESNLPILTIDEIKDLAQTKIMGENSTLGGEVKRAFLFSCYTGLRISDLKSLTWQDIEERKITDSNRCSNWIKKRQVKTRRIVEIPIANPALQLILPRNFPNSFVFPNLATSKTQTDAYIKDWASRAGILKKISWHTARRSTATILLDCGVDPLTIQRILGHKKIDTTTIYAKSTETMKSRAVSAIPDFIGNLDSGKHETLVLNPAETA